MSKPNTELVERIEEILAYFFDNAYKYSSRTIQHPSMTTSHIKTVEALEQLIIDEKIALLQDICRDNWQKSIPEMYMLDRISSLKELRDS
jgi:hypothetical protein